MRRLAGIYVAFTLALVGCGTSAGEDTASDPPGSSQDVAASAEASAKASDDGPGTSANPDDPFGFGKEANTATVTVGDETYEFSNLYCVTMGGALGAQSIGAGLGVHIDLPPMDWETSDEGWDAPSISIKADDPYLSLLAGGDFIQYDNRVDESMTQVNSFDSDGHHATGTATFIDYNTLTLSGEIITMAGSFEVTCAA
jgi:hypothetical protein